MQSQDLHLMKIADLEKPTYVQNIIARSPHKVAPLMRTAQTFQEGPDKNSITLCLWMTAVSAVEANA